MKPLQELTEHSRIEQLTALRDKLAIAIDECGSKRDLASLSKQYRDILQEIDFLKQTDKNESAEIDNIINS